MGVQKNNNESLFKRSFLFIFLRRSELLYYFHSTTMFCGFLSFLGHFSFLFAKNLFPIDGFCIKYILKRYRIEASVVKRLKKLKSPQFEFLLWSSRYLARSRAREERRRKIVRCITSNHHTIDLWCSRMTCASFFFSSYSTAHHELNEKTCSKIVL